MILNLSRKHPQGIPFTNIVLVFCTQCGELEMEMHHNASRARNDDNNEPTYRVGKTCLNCFFKD